jgi:hypothetical protein
VKQAEEAAAEAETQGLGHFGLELQGGVVEAQLFEGFAQLVVFVGLHRVQAREHLGLDLLEAGQRLRSACGCPPG